MSVGTYVTLAGAKARLGWDPATPTTPELIARDALLQTICDQVNDYIESFTGRVLAPVPAFSTTLSGSVSAGATAVTLSTIDGLAVGDELMFGPLAGVHESATVNVLGIPISAVPAWAALTVTILGHVIQPTAPNGHTYICVFAGTTGASQPTFPTNGSAVIDGTVVWLDQGTASTVVTLATPLISGYANTSPVLRVMIFDGFSATDFGRSLLIPSGIWRLDFLEVATFTGGAFAQVPNNNLFLLPRAQDRTPGWPATEIWQSNVPTSANTNPVFFPGFGTGRVGGGLGWQVVQPTVTGLALNHTVTTWQMRASGGSYQVDVGTGGQQSITRILSSLDWGSLNRYKRKDIYVVGGSEYGWAI